MADDIGGDGTSAVRISEYPQMRIQNEGVNDEGVYTINTPCKKIWED